MNRWLDKCNGYLYVVTVLSAAGEETNTVSRDNGDNKSHITRKMV